jgi:hypothetical protein
VPPAAAGQQLQLQPPAAAGEKTRGRQQAPQRPGRRNTQSFEPLARAPDMRVVLDLGTAGGRLTAAAPVASRDVLLVPNLFADFAPLELYGLLRREIEACGVPRDRLLKPWHGDTHLIADDKTPWKRAAPTFDLVLARLGDFFDMDIQATRLNVYEDTSQWKPFHHDAAAVKPDKAAVQNFTVAVSFGATRDAAFEAVRGGTVVSMPQADGAVYAFARDANVLWRHGILREKEPRPEGRISVIAWGSVAMVDAS